MSKSNATSLIMIMAVHTIALGVLVLSFYSGPTQHVSETDDSPRDVVLVAICSDEVILM